MAQGDVRLVLEEIDFIVLNESFNNSYYISISLFYEVEAAFLIRQLAELSFFTVYELSVGSNYITCGLEQMAAESQHSPAQQYLGSLIG